MRTPSTQYSFLAFTFHEEGMWTLNTIKNNQISIEIDELMGGQIQSIIYKNKEFLSNFDWKSPLGHRKSETYGSGVLDWLSEYRGGWQSLFPNAGNENTVMGVPLPFHGEFSRSHVEIVKKGKSEIVVRSGVRLPLVLTRSYKLLSDKPTLKVQQTVTNESDLDIPFIWGEHPAFCLPSGSRINLPKGGEVHVDSNEMGDLQDVLPGGIGSWPLAPTKSGVTVDLSVVPRVKVERLCYLPDLPQGWVAMESGETIFGLSWDLKAFPHLWFWQEIGGTGFPWFGRTNITAIEPASTWPSFGLAEAIKKGQAITLKPKESASSWVTFSVSTLPTEKLMQVEFINDDGDFKCVN